MNTWMTAEAAREAWKFLGKPENVLWYWRSGVHAQTPEDFEMLIRVIEREYRGKPLGDGFMNTPFEIPELIYDWKCPEII